MSLRFLPSALGLVLLGSVSANADTPVPASVTEAEQQLADLTSQMYKSFRLHADTANKIEDAEARQAFKTANDPKAIYLARLVEFAKEHRGSRAGLLAIWRLFLISGGPPSRDDPSHVACREVLPMLDAYVDDPLLPEVLNRLPEGLIDQQVDSILRELAAKTTSAVNRDYARYKLADCWLMMRATLDSQYLRLKELSEGDEPNWPKEESNLRQWRSAAPSAEEFARQADDAKQQLEQLVRENSVARVPQIKSLDERWYLIGVDDDASTKNPTIASMAEGTLFAENHLRVLAQAPELDVALIDGKRWSLAEQRGRTVIIQFSFKGCGPCERMYPTLDELRRRYGDRLAILSVMADEERETTLQAVESGKMSWNVTWDGSKGPLATRWAVHSFPSVWVIDRRGFVNAVDLLDDDLSRRIARLCGEPSEGGLEK